MCYHLQLIRSIYLCGLCVVTGLLLLGTYVGVELLNRMMVTFELSLGKPPDCVSKQSLHLAFSLAGHTVDF